MGAADKDKKGPLQLRQLLGATRGPGLKSLLQRARALEVFGRELRQSLPPELRTGWALGRVDDKELVLVADSSAWATRLRYSRPLIIKAARDIAGLELKTLTIKIAAQRLEPKLQLKAPRLGPSAARTLRQAASALDETDSRLSRALRRLATRGEN